MVSLAFHLFVFGTVNFALTVVVHSFVADSSLLDFYDLVAVFCVFSTFCLQVGNRLGF